MEQWRAAADEETYDSINLQNGCFTRRCYVPAMDRRLKRILLRASAATAVALISTFSIFFATRLAINVPYTPLDLKECFFITLAVAFPISSYIFAQSEKLRDAYRELTELHASAQRTNQELKQAHDLLSYVASRDGMTGLLNRERFMAHLDRAHREGEASVLLIIDADKFKQINDSLGHQKGDEALIKIAEAIRSSVPLETSVGRIGGEEFAVLLTATETTDAFAVAETIRRRVGEIPWLPGEAPLSVSIGGASLTDYHQVSHVLRQADRCLYAAKRSGRNQTVFSAAMSQVA